jgi:hypothetical protein
VAPESHSAMIMRNLSSIRSSACTANFQKNQSQSPYEFSKVRSRCNSFRPALHTSPFTQSSTSARPRQTPINPRTHNRHLCYGPVLSSDYFNYAEESLRSQARPERTPDLQILCLETRGQRFRDRLRTQKCRIGKD